MPVETAPAPLLSAQHWVDKRRKNLQDLLEQLVQSRKQLEELHLWRAKDSLRLATVIFEMADYVSSLILDPVRSYASHKDLCLAGPGLMIPRSPDCLAYGQYVFRVDDHIRLLIDLARQRLTYDRMIKNEPPPPVESLPFEQKRWRAWQTFEFFIYDRLENRPECRRYVKTMEALLEKAVADELDLRRPLTKRYHLESLTIEVTGATRMRLDLNHLPLDLRPADMLAVTRVADALPQMPVYEPHPLDRKGAELAALANQAKLDRFRRDFDRAWRSLTDLQVAEILRRFAK